MDSTMVELNEILDQINANLTNALNTFGASSQQYQNILKILKECLNDIENDKMKKAAALDTDTLSLAMKFLELGK